MKRFFENLTAILIVVAVAVGLIALLWFTSGGFRSMCIDIGGGSGIMGILVLPFALIGGIDIVRGFFLVSQEDGDKFHGDKNSGKLYACIVLRFLGYLGIFFAFANVIN